MTTRVHPSVGAQRKERFVSGKVNWVASAGRLVVRPEKREERKVGKRSRACRRRDMSPFPHDITAAVSLLRPPMRAACAVLRQATAFTNDFDEHLFRS